MYVIVVTCAGDGFCSGTDVTEMPDRADQTEAEFADFLRSVQNVVHQLRSPSKPTIAAANGPAVGDRL